MARLPSPFLQQLRCMPARWQWTEQTIADIVRCQNEFPVKLRKVIQSEAVAYATNPDPERFYEHLRTAAIYLFRGKLGSTNNADPSNNYADSDGQTPWLGLDAEIDTEDEAETLARCFPGLLYEGVSIICILTWSIRSLPFVPLFAEIANDWGILHWGRVGYPLDELLTNRSLLEQVPRLRNNENFRRKLDKVSRSVLIRLKEKGLLGKDQIPGILVKLITRVSDQSLCFLLDWDPNVLKRGSNPNRPVSLMRSFLYKCAKDKEYRVLERFRGILQFGMLYYPEEIGFLFHQHKRYYFPFDNIAWANELFGEDQVNRVVDEVLLEHTRGQSEAMRTLVFAAATNPEIPLNGLYTLYRRDPMQLLSNLQG